MKAPNKDYELIRQSFEGKQSFNLGTNNKFEQMMMAKNK